MRVLILITLSFLCRSLYGQTDSSIHHFKEIGWTINISPDFKTVDSATTASAIATGKTMVEGTMKKEINMSHLINLIDVSRDRFNYLIANLDNATSINEQNWQTADKSTKDIFYKTFVAQIPSPKIDTVSSIKIIDGVDFKIFKIDIPVNNKVTIHTCLMTTFYKSLYFSITYLYTDDEAGKEINEMIDESKFDK